MLAPCTVTVAVGIPLKTTLLAVAEEMLVLTSNVMVTVALPPPNTNPSVFVVITAPDVEIKLVPVSGPTIETPYPLDVMVDEITVRPVPDPAPT